MDTFWTFRECTIVFHVKHEGSKKVNVVVAGGRAPAKGWLRAISSQREIYCADRGAEYCLSAGHPPTVLVGDGDSADEAAYSKARKLRTRVFLHPQDKEDTDLQLTLKKIKEGDVLATGVFGGRLDHLFSNIYSLLAFKKKRDCRVALADGKEYLVLLGADEKVEIYLEDKEKKPPFVSLLPLSAKCRVNIRGVRWPLNDALLTQARPYAISNEPLSKNFICSCTSGDVGLYISWLK